MERKMTVKDFLMEMEKENETTRKMRKEVGTIAGVVFSSLMILAIVFGFKFDGGLDQYDMLTLGFIACIFLVTWLLVTFGDSYSSHMVIKRLKEGDFTFTFETAIKIMKKNGKIPIIETKEGNLYVLPEAKEVAIGDKLLVATIKDKKRVYTEKEYAFTELNDALQSKCEI